jgi:tellurite resistance protein TerC
MVLAGMIDRFRYLNVGLAAVLVFVGVKMTLSDIYKVPVYASLVVIVLTLALAVGASVLVSRRDETDHGAPAPSEDVRPAAPAAPAAPKGAG